jgi:very-short-patch-repair endonuclease
MLSNFKKPKKALNPELRWNNSEPVSKIFRKKLLEKQTRAEKVVGQILTTLNVEYEQQHILHYNAEKFFILDIYIPHKRICIELDGKHHLKEEYIKKDKLRTTILNKLNIKVFRFENKETLDPNFIWKIINLYQNN